MFQPLLRVYIKLWRLRYRAVLRRINSLIQLRNKFASAVAQKILKKKTTKLKYEDCTVY
jgi:hypothetical protein